MALKYIKSFDGLRGFGALMILLYHWPYANFTISHGWEFMQVFFVMSGYLITMVLLEEKKKYSFKKFAGRFYVKRALRLFPLYFAYLLAALFLFIITSESGLFTKPMATDIAKHGVYLFTYTYNLMEILNFWTGYDYTSTAWSTHLWTLSMEEQFYLVFPFLVFFFSLKQMRKLVIFAIIGAAVFRIVSFEWYSMVNPGDKKWIAQNLVRIPFGQMDSFAFGAVVALFPLNFIKNAKRWFLIITGIVVSAYLINMAYVYYIEGETYYALTYGKKYAEGWIAHNYLFAYIITLVNLWCAVLILYLRRTKKRVGIFENKPIVFFGRLSYGIYLLHLPILFLFNIFIKKFWPNEFVNSHWYIELSLLIIFLAISITICHLINKHFESRFIRYKNKIMKRPDSKIKSSFPEQFKSDPNKIALHDKWGEITYGSLNLLISMKTERLQKEGLFNQRIGIKGENDRHLVALICALLCLKNEVMFQEVKSTKTEDDEITSFYRLNAFINLSETEEGKYAVVKKQSFNHEIKEALLYYFSSGSTGIPKAFGYNTEKIYSQFTAWTKYIQQKESDIVLCPLTISHFHGSILTFSSLFCGSQVIFTKNSHLDIPELTSLLSRHQPSIMTGVPYLYQKLLANIGSGFNGFKNMKFAICGSAPMSANLSKKYFEKTGIYLNQAYGLSEIGAICIDLNPNKKLGTVGKILPYIDYKIVDEIGDTVLSGSEGELLVRADFMVTEYLYQDEITNEMFNDGWLYTKDIVREDEAKRITILGRKSHFLNVAGQKVFPEEIEKLIQGKFSKITAAVRNNAQSERKGLTVFIEQDSEIDLEAIQKVCEENLAAYKWPSTYKFVESLPKNDIGKILYQKIEA